MPTFVLQSVIPLMFLLALPGLDRRKILLLWPLTHAPDLDYVIGYHRATLHNVWVVLPFVAAFVWAAAFASPRRPALAQWMGIAGVYVGSHVLMDVWAGGSTLFYPLSLRTYCYYGYVDVKTATNTPIVDFGACSFTGIPVVSETYPWLWGIETSFLAFLVPATLAVLGWRWWAGRRPSP